MSIQAKSKETQKEQNLTERTSEDARASARRSIVRVASVALTVVAVALTATGISNFAGSSGQRLPNKVEREVSALLGGIPQKGEMLGQTSAPITLQIFGDLESEDVRTFVIWILPKIIRDWVRTNTVNIQYRSFMNYASHDSKVFVSQQVAALAAGTQNKLWNFIETFYHEQGKEYTHYVTEGYLNTIAEQVPGLNLSQWDSDLENNQLAKKVARDDHAALAVGFQITPSFLIGRTGGKLMPWKGYQLYEEQGPKGIRRPLYPLSYITNHTLQAMIEGLP